MSRIDYEMDLLSNMLSNIGPFIHRKKIITKNRGNQEIDESPLEFKTSALNKIIY